VTLNAAGKQSSSSLGWGFLWVIFFGLALAGAGAYAVYKYRLRVNLQFALYSTCIFFVYLVEIMQFN
jgi:hypothetical protein